MDMNASDDDETESNRAISIAQTESTGITQISSTSASTAPQIIESNSTPVNNVQLNQIKLQPPIPISQNSFILPQNGVVTTGGNTNNIQNNIQNMINQNVITTNANILGNQNMLGSNQVIINGQGGPILLPQNSVESMDTSQFGSNLAQTSGLPPGTTLTLIQGPGGRQIPINQALIQNQFEQQQVHSSQIQTSQIQTSQIQNSQIQNFNPQNSQNAQISQIQTLQNQNSQGQISQSQNSQIQLPQILQHQNSSHSSQNLNQQNNIQQNPTNTQTSPHTLTTHSPQQQQQTVAPLILQKPPEIKLINADEIQRTRDLFLLGTGWFFAKTGVQGGFTVEPVLIDLIQRYGGVVLENCDFSMITHLVLPDQCKTKGNNSSSSQNNSDGSGVFQQSEAALFRQCIVRGRFTVTIDYLLDILNIKELPTPWKWTHIPNPIGPLTPIAQYLIQKPNMPESLIIPKPKKSRSQNIETILKNHTISLTGFNLHERNEVSTILRKLGCSVHVHLNKTCTLLMASQKSILTPENYTLKVKRAQEWKLPVVTFNWLRDIILGVKTANTSNGILKYFVTLGNTSSASSLSGKNSKVHSLARAGVSEIHIDPERIPHIMSSWRQGNGVRKCNILLLENSDVIFDQHLQLYKPVPRVLLTGFDLDEHSRLMSQIEQLNGKPVKSMFACTHLVTNKVKRTVKFLSGLSVCNHVLTSLWIVDSYKSVENGVPEWRNEENYRVVF